MLNLKMSQSSRAFIEKNCPNALKEKDLRSALLALDDFITMFGLDENDDMTPLGNDAQRIYDEIYCCNK